MRGLTILLLLGGLVGVNVCGGCQDKFTRQRYETVYLGMPDWQVRRTLGEPSVDANGVWSYVHHQPYYSATIGFENTCVKHKSWSYEKPK